MNIKFLIQLSNILLVELKKKKKINTALRVGQGTHDVKLHQLLVKSKSRSDVVSKTEKKSDINYDLCELYK